ncbi:MAG TPA: transglycosylase domain-containing protein [Bacteroidota bacterium]|nr:transglycosylase domain-containing protein [Bacteroidota bacterium]
MKKILLLLIFVNIYSFSQNLPPINIEYASKVISDDGKLIGYFGNKNRIEIFSTSSVSKHVINCLISTEDREFYEHDGVSVKGLIRAAWQTLLGSKQGGSTLTMQLARNLFLSNEQTIERKLSEIELAQELEKKYNKDQILLLYLNTVYFGRGAYGIWAASQEYFQKTPDRLTINESALLIGLLKSPNGYDPIKYPEKALKRRNEVLHNLVEVGKLTQKDYEKLKILPLNLNLRENIGGYYLEYIRKILNEHLYKYGKVLEKDQIEIKIPLDSRIQKAAENAINYQFNLFPNNMKNVQIGLICIENKTGYIKAMVGGNPSSNFKGLNHATQIKRQPGSSFKPFLYGSLLEKGYDLSTPLLDSPIVIIDSITKISWEPQNDDSLYTGKAIPMILAIKDSKNLCAAYAIKNLTNPDSVISFAKRLGITSDLYPYPSIALGTSEVSPIEMARAITTIASGGLLHKLISIKEIKDKYNNVWWQESIDTIRVLDTKICYLLTYALQTVIDSGTAKSIRRFYSYPAAGKTGTTQNYTDAWFVGFTPNLTTAIWIGFDNPQNKLSGLYRYGGSAAAPIWGKMMAEIVRKIPEYYKSKFIIPEGIEFKKTCIEYKKDMNCIKELTIPFINSQIEK